MLTLIIPILVGTLIPWIVFSEKDKRTPDGYYTLNRLKFVGWFVGCFFLAAVGNAINSLILGKQIVTIAAFLISLAYISMRRLADIGWSKWWSLLGLFPPATIALMFIPGKAGAKEEEAVNAASSPTQLPHAQQTRTENSLRTIAWIAASVAGVLLFALIVHVGSTKTSSIQNSLGRTASEERELAPVVERVVVKQEADPVVSTPSTTIDDAEFTTLQRKSLDAAVKRYGEGLKDDNSEFSKLCDAEYEKANAASDTIFLKPDWPERIAERVAGTLYLQADKNPNFSTLKALAEIGQKESQWKLSLAYIDGVGTDKNESEAVKWCRKAAEQGVADAQHYLGVCYQIGAGFDKDAREAVKWYRKAAEQGDADGLNNLGACYYTGDGVPKDSIEALKWFTVAAAKGSEQASEWIATCEKEMSQEQVAEARRRSEDFKVQKVNDVKP